LECIEFLGFASPVSDTVKAEGVEKKLLDLYLLIIPESSCPTTISLDEMLLSQIQKAFWLKKSSFRISVWKGEFLQYSRNRFAPKNLIKAEFK